MWRELDSRTSAGLTVSLDWNSLTDQIQVTTVDAADATVGYRKDFPRDRALEVFEHPYGWESQLEEIAA